MNWKFRRQRPSRRVSPFKRLTLEPIEARVVLATDLIGTVWQDQNADGLQTVGELGVQYAVAESFSSANCTIGDADDVSLGTRVTDSSGNYQFTSLTAGLNYYLVVRPPVGFTFTTQDAGNETLDSDVGATTGRSVLFTPSAGQILDLDAGLTGSAPAFGWALGLGSTSDDQSYSVATDPNGNVIVTGSFSGTVDFDPGPAQTSLTALGLSDIFVAKYGATGGLLWAKRVGEDRIYTDAGLGVTVDPNGNILVTGQFTGTVDFDPGSGVTQLSSFGGTWDVFILKLDANGNFVWARSVGGGSDDVGASIATDAAGNVYTTGRFVNTVDFDPGAGTFNLNSGGLYGSFILKLDASGIFSWAAGLTGNSTGHAVAVDSAQNVYVTGELPGSSDFDPGAGTLTLSSAGDHDIYVWKLNSSGGLVWAKRMGSTGRDHGNAIAVDTDQSVFVAGRFNGTVDFDPGAGTANLVSAGGDDAFVFKLDSNGNYAWAKRFGGNSSDVAYSMTLGANGRPYVVGSFSGTVDFDPNAGVVNRTAAGGTDGFAVRLDGTGALDGFAAYRLGGTGNEIAYGAAIDAAGNLYAAGSFTGSTDLDPGVGNFSLTSAGGQDGFLAKLNTSLPLPTVVSIDRTTPSAAITNATTVTYTVTFGEDVTGVDDTDFQLAFVGVTTSSLVVMPISGSVYTVTIGGMTGDGTIGLNLVDDGSIVDALGNRLDTAGLDRSFLTQRTYSVGSQPFSAVMTDVNGDGKLDLVAADFGSNRVSVLLGNGDGTFQVQQTYLVGTNPFSVVVADFNGDSKPDLIVTNTNGSNVSLLLGNGNGTFQAQQTYAVGTNPYSVTVADFNGDGKADLAVANRSSNTLSVLLGNGNGTFQAQRTFATGANPFVVSAADLNNDGKLDLAVANRADNTVSVLLGNGNGTFQAQVTFATGTNPISVAIADFDGDGKPDLAITNVNSDSVSVLLGNGNGSFQAQRTFATGSAPYLMSVTDVDGDGKLDLAVSNRNSGTVSVLLGNSNGTFRAQKTYATGSAPWSVVASDVNGDGNVDLAVANSGSNTVGILVNAASFTGQIYTIDQTIPTIKGVYARGIGAGSENWNPSFLTYLSNTLDANNHPLGDAALGYTLSNGGAQLKTLPWTNVNTISIGFSEGVTIAQDDLTVIGAANGPVVPTVAGFSWDAGTFTGTWTFNAALPRNKYLLHIGSTVVDAAGSTLDGEWNVSSSTSSGNGTAGGDFNFRFNVLPGDFDGSNGVTITEVLQARNRAGKGTASVGYAYREDVDGSGGITITEVLQSRNRAATSITGLNEPVAPGSTPQSPLELAPLVPGAEEGDYISPYTPLTNEELAPIVDEAIARWEASGLVPAGFDWSKLRFAITDLGPAYLGLGNPDGSILLDDDGAGWGWFVDKSPSDDSEFAGGTADAAAAAHMDLLTVVMHEIGHALGYPTGTALGTPAESLMSEFLAIGERRTLEFAFPSLEPALSDVLADEAQTAPMLGFTRLSEFDFKPLALGQVVGAMTEPVMAAAPARSACIIAASTHDTVSNDGFVDIQSLESAIIALDADSSESAVGGRSLKSKKLDIGSSTDRWSSSDRRRERFE